MSPKSHSVHLLLLAALAATSGAAPVLSSIDLRQLDAAEQPGVERREIDIGAGIIAGEAPAPSKPLEVSDAALNSRTLEGGDWDPLDEALGGLLSGNSKRSDVNIRAAERRQWNPLGGGTSPDRRARAMKWRRSDPSEGTLADPVDADIEDRAVAERQWNGLALADTPIFLRSEPEEKRQWDFLTLAAGSADAGSESHLEKKRQWNPFTLAAGLAGGDLGSRLEEKRQWDFLTLAAGSAARDSESQVKEKRQWEFVALGDERPPDLSQRDANEASKRQYDFLELGTDHDPSHPLSADKRQWNPVGLGIGESAVGESAIGESALLGAY